MKQGFWLNFVRVLDDLFDERELRYLSTALVLICAVGYVVVWKVIG